MTTDDNAPVPPPRDPTGPQARPAASPTQAPKSGKPQVAGSGGILSNIGKMFEVPQEFYNDIANKFRFLPETNYRMGCEFADQGLFRDAIFRLKIALWLNPKHPRAWYVLGSCYYARGETSLAIGALQHALRLNPNSDEAQFMMAMISPKHVPADKRPRTMPRHMAMEYFERIADAYEFQQREMGYVGHVVLDEALRPYIDTRQVNFRMLDLGCGTGLTGVMLADVAGHMTGVDFCRPMLDHAMRRRRRDGGDIYLRTILRDLRDYLQEVDKASFDLVTASHVFNFVGDLSTVFPGVSKALHENGLFGFQVEPFAGETYALLQGLGRFGHSEPYIRKMADDYGFEILEMKKVEVYPNYPLDQYVLKKKP